MKKRLLGKLLLAYVAFAILSLSVIDFYTTPKSIERVDEAEAERLHKEAIALAENYGYRFYNKSITKESLEDYLEIYASYLNCDVWVVSTKGNIDGLVNLSDGPSPNFIKDFDIMEMFGDSYYLSGTFHSYYKENYLSVYAPITVKYNVKGYIILHEPTTLSHSYAMRTVSLTRQTVLLCLLFSLIILFVVCLAILKPIHKLCAIAKEYSNGNYKPLHKLRSNDELFYLGEVLGFMATRLDTHEDEQRKFISNVSHDFRSPLTSIRGYIQALLDGTIPPELYPKYLTIVSNETERLTHLTNNLLDLNRIGSREATLELSDFDINTVISSCAESSEVQCIAKNVKLSLILCGEQMLVHADKSKIQQIIYNLLDNAIKFSKPNTTITIETSQKGEKLLVSVADQGIGIPSDSLDNIFNRFYKSDLSRGKDKKGTGLGLSIVKEIIQAHNEVINVVSTVDVGTKFTFTLRISDTESDE